MSRPYSVRLLTAILLIATAFCGCGGKARDRLRSQSHHPLVLFAVDGLEWDVMLPLVARGQLPAMARLMEQGSFGYLRSMRPTLSPVIWTSLATAKTPAKHGITNFVYSTGNGNDRELRVFTSGHRRTKAFWNILSDYGLVVHCIGWWITYPAEPINGVMVSQTNTSPLAPARQGRQIWKGSLISGLEGQVYPPARQEEIMAILQEVDASLAEITKQIFGTPPHPPDPFSTMMWEETQWAFRADATYLRVAGRLLASNAAFDVMAVYIGGPDVVGHRFWRYAYPESFRYPPSRDQIDNYGHIIDDYYKYTDQAIGQILSTLPADTTVVIVSDHGMHAVNQDQQFRPEDTPRSIYSGHHFDAPPGVFIAAGWGIRTRIPPGPRASDLSRSDLVEVGSVLDIVPTMLALKGIPIGEDMDGTPLRDVLSVTTLKERPIRFLPSHDTDEWLAHRDSLKKVPRDQAERLEQLRALGYID
jgi:hypothetical protein